MKLYKLLIPLLLMSVQGVAQKDSMLSLMPPEEFWKQYEQYSCGTPGCLVMHVRLKQNAIIQNLDSCDQQKLEIQTLRLLNDSLTKKLRLLLEWQELACSIIESVGVVKTVNGYRLLVNKREMIKPAVRYYKQYKTEK